MLVVVTRKLPRAVEERMRALFDVELNATDRPLSQDELASAAARADVLVPTVTDRIDATVIERAGPRLRLLANFGVGVNHVDLRAAQARGIQVSNTPGVLTDATADIAMLLILAVTRRASAGERLLREGRFTGWTPTFHLGTSLRGKRLAVVGLGRIGQALARRARAFGLDIHYHNRQRVSRQTENELAASYEPDLDLLLAEADVVSLHCPLTPQTRHLFSSERLSRIRPSAYLVNTARGEIVDEAALAARLRSGALAGAGLDVYEAEPEVHPDLLGLDNVVLLPHLGSATEEARSAMGQKVIQNISALAAGEPLPDTVLP
ncbi:MAG: D-glycerate dehydrogenase [Polyangiaceae bacterium]